MAPWPEFQLKCELHVVALHRPSIGREQSEPRSELRASVVPEQWTDEPGSGRRRLRGGPEADLQRHIGGQDAEVREQRNASCSFQLVVFDDLPTTERSPPDRV